MKFTAQIAAFAVLAIARGVYALPTVWPTLPPVENADTETVTNVPFASWEEGLCRFTFTLDFCGSASNNVELAFGTDANADGILSDGETDLTVGWDCGEWFILNNATDEKTVSPAADGEHVFSCLFEMRSSGRIVDISYKDNGTAVFADLAAVKPSWLYSTEWNMVRLVGRGENVRSGERFSVQARPSGFVFRLR